MIHLPTYESSNGRTQAVCSCGWSSPWLSTRDDAVRVHMRHAEFERTNPEGD